jgi:hypothetical protein
VIPLHPKKKLSVPLAETVQKKHLYLGYYLNHPCPFKFKTMLPKFLLADNSQVLPDTIFIIHTEAPRFIVGCDLEGFNVDQEIHWIDEEPESADLKAELLEQAEEFMELELDYEEELDKLDEEEDK